MRRIIWSGFLATCILMPCAGLLAQEEPTSEIERLRQSGAPTVIEDFKPEPPGQQEDNAAYWLARAETGRTAIDMELAEAFAFEAPATEAFVAQFNEISGQHPQTWEYLERATDSPRFAPDINFNSVTTGNEGSFDRA